MNYLRISRRSFIKFGTAAVLLPIYATESHSGYYDEIKEVAALRANLLQLINEEREVEKVGLLELDDFATEVATAHAAEMAAQEYVSHWDTKGLKPYQRYSFAGGYHATQENVSAADNTWSAKFEHLKQDTSYLHVRLYSEKPPNDGHRRSILAPQHTHVGIGIALEKLRLRVVEVFVSKYVDLKPVARSAKPGTLITLGGRLLQSSYILSTIEVFYEPLPRTPELSWLREPRSYGLPYESEVLRPILSAPYQYADKKPGIVRVEANGSFDAPVTLFKQQPGIYTVVFWVKRNREEKAFPATQLCIRAE
jgi:uncharacterized protein YkwD